jgi:glycosyltransferase involved in cell wall biosynthesis
MRRLKITFLINSLEGGGAERVVSTLAFHLAARGHDLSILTLQPARAAYPLPEGVRVTELGGSFLAFGPMKLLALPVQARRLRRYVERSPPDVMVSFLVRANLVHVLSARSGRALPMVLREGVQATEHYSGSMSKLLMRRLVAALYPRADSVIAISTGVKESLVALGVPAGKVTVIHNPVDAAELEPRRTRSPLLDRRIVHLVTLGRLVGFKDQKTIVRALSAVRRRGYEARLTMIGDGPLRAKLEAEIRALGLDRHVRVTGWVARPHALVADADIFVFSSLYEAFGNVITEALACGVPVVSSDCPGGPREILEGGRYGLLFPVGDSEAMAERIIELVEDPALYERLRRTGLERAAQFSVDIIGEQYLEALRRAARKKA